MAGRIWVGKPGSVLSWEGRTLTLGEGTYAREGHPILDAYPHEFEPVTVTFDTEQPTASPGPASETTQTPNEPDSPADDAPHEPSAREQPDTKPDAKAVRVWAAEQGIDVPQRGKLPSDVIEQYVAARE